MKANCYKRIYPKSLYTNLHSHFVVFVPGTVRIRLRTFQTDFSQLYKRNIQGSLQRLCSLTIFFLCLSSLLELFANASKEIKEGIRKKIYEVRLYFANKLVLSYISFNRIEKTNGWTRFRKRSICSVIGSYRHSFLSQIN